MPSGFREQVRLVLFLEVVIVIVAGSIAYGFWETLCNGEVLQCLKREDLSPPGFLILSFFRPLLFTPLAVFGMMAGNLLSPFLAACLTSLGAVLSCMILYTFGKILGHKLVTPWIRRNLPQTFRFIKSQDWKVILASRLIPFLPFDLMTFCFGLWDLPFYKVALYTFLGTLPEHYILANFADPNGSWLDSTLTTLTWFGMFFLLPGVIIEYMSRKKGSGLWQRLKAMGEEIISEVQDSNEIIKRNNHVDGKIPVLLLYGFFSSRRSLTALERLLSHRGYEVFSFNLGGLFGVFFTRSIIETAQFIDYKIKRQIDRYDFKEIHIVAHSKGGFVALWWLLKMGGTAYCKTLITLGTPFRGSPLTWLALLTPVGFIFRDMWQMKPGSSFLKELHQAPIPPSLKITNIYSYKDKVAKGPSGIFFSEKALPGTINPVMIDDVGHFEFLRNRKVADHIAQILKSASS